MEALSCYKAASKRVWEGYIADSKASRVEKYTTNVSEFLSKAALANSCLSISSTFLVVGKTLVIMQVLQISFLATNLMSALLNFRKTILRTTSILVSTSKKVFSKNRNFSRLSQSKNPAVVITQVFRGIPSIFSILIFVGLDIRPSLAAKIGIIVLTLLLESIKVQAC